MTQRSSLLTLTLRIYVSLLLPALLLLSCADDGDATKEDGNEADARDASSADGDSAGGDSGAGGATARDSGSGSTAASDAGRSDGGQSGMGDGASDAGLDATVARDAAIGRDASSTADASSSADAGKVDASTVEPTGLERFSFFVTSQAAIVELAKNPKGFGGDLRYGETGSGAGLRGADKICGEIAESSMEGAGKKQWRAFLSASAGGANGGAVNARDRIGAGPWYDRKGRLLGNALADLLSGDRPSAADAMIRDDLPNETGVGNRAPNGTPVDNHDTLTGSDNGGRYVSGSNTCLDWTSIAASGGGGGGGGNGPAIGHSWPRSANNGRNWISDHRAGGCAQGINTSNGTSDGTATVGSGGGYGGFYCFALSP